MLERVFEIYNELREERAEWAEAMSMRHPRKEEQVLYPIANFRIPALKITQGTADIDSAKREVVPRVSEEYFVVLRSLGESTGISQLRLDSAWKRVLKKECGGDPKRAFRRHGELVAPFLRSDSGWHLHIRYQLPLIFNDLKNRRPYHSAIDEMCIALLPERDRLNFRNRRKTN